MHIKRCGTVRADGRLYCLLDLGLEINLAGEWPCASASLDGYAIPVELFPQREDDPSRTWVLVLPFFPRATFHVVVSCAGDQRELSISCPRARWESSYTYRARKNLVGELNGIQARWICNRMRPTLDRLLQGGDCDVWRLCLTWAGARDAEPRLRIVGEHGEALDVPCFDFESQSDVPASWGGTIERRYYSIQLPQGCHHFAVEASDASGSVTSGFCGCDEPFWRYREHETWQFMRDARADDERYRAWFEEHRSHAGDLEAQAGVHFSYEPRISIVVPCYRSDKTFLSELVASVARQSYGKWELLLVNASPEDPTVEQVANVYRQDNRICIIPLTANEGITGNTNRGIEAAQGDYIAFLDHDDVLEPDALFWYVKALNDRSSRPDVLFCDEDLFSQWGMWRQPIFKTRLNVDLLYSHNCVTHFLCVNSALLRRIGCSSEDVTGAQDYDLTLRALAAGARFEHVPHVLYHWREHEGSTSGDNVGGKPYAEEAGRLALERHMALCGASATVDVTDQLFVYRVRYELPSPHPLVSIIIPSKDHADVLRRCVESIFARSTYDSFEVVVVENHSVEQTTFDAYRELFKVHGDAFRVLDVSADVEGFNYSRLVNLGAHAAKGEYLLLLNNDTEVISPDFIEEMLGYLQRPNVGVVGAKLFFRDGLTQHAGMLVGPHGAVAHANQDFYRTREGYLARAVRPGNFSAVTGACQMVRHSTFNEVGGYDESFAVGFNDVDFCFRVRETGKLVTFTPYAELFHDEFVSRGREVADVGKLERWQRECARFTERWPQVFLDGDPYTNPNLDRNSAYYGL